MATQPQTFVKAQVGYAKARLAADDQMDETRDRTLAAVDDAVDAFLATPSPSPRAFGEKLCVLERKYGRDWQPRHIDALLADVLSLAS